MNHHLTRRARRGSLLGLTMILCFLASVLAMTTLSLGTQNRKLTLRARSQSDATRAALSGLNHLAAQVRATALAPNAGRPDIAFTGFKPAIPSPAELGVDTGLYDDKSTRIELIVLKDGLRKVNKDQFAVPTDRPETADDPDANSFVDELWSIPLRARITLYPKGRGAAHSTSTEETPLAAGAASGYVKPADAFVCTMECSLQLRVKSLLQVALFFDGPTPWLPGGANTYRGGIHSNKPIFIWAAGSALSQTQGARIQVERISAPKVLFRNYGPADGLPNSFARWGYPTASQAQALYIGRGDLNQDGKMTAYAATPNSTQWVSQNRLNPDTDEYRPAYSTLWDSGATSAFANYWKINPASASPRIDSENPDIGNLSTLFNGNFKDSKTGFQEIKVSSLATTSPRSLIEPADPAKAPDDPVEKEKFANNANVYLYVETTPRFAGDAVPRVLAFKPSIDPATGELRSAAQAAVAYKNTDIASPESLQSVQKNLAASGTLLALPSGVVETTRRFIDYTQQKQNAGDTATPRVSSVDIDMGKLREALGTADVDNPATPEVNEAAVAVKQLAVETAEDGAEKIVPKAWDPNDKKTGWNGVLYVEVDNPQGAGWSADAPPAAPTRQQTDATGNPVFDVDGNPVMVATETAIAPAPQVDRNGYATQNLTAVRVHNAQSLPDRAGTSGYDQAEGLTLATNTVVYTVGNVNADGRDATDSSFGTSSGAGSELESNSTLGQHQFPFAIAADAVTVMPAKHTNPYNNAAFGNNLTEGDNAANSTNAAANLYYRESFTELNFAIIAGGGDPSATYQSRRPIQLFSPSRWEGNMVRYRGSVITLFESKFAKKWAGGNGSQQAQGIDIGFERSYSLGFIPPSVPRSHTSTLVNCAIVADADFDNAKFPAPSRKAPSL